MPFLRSHRLQLVLLSVAAFLSVFLLLSAAAHGAAPPGPHVELALHHPTAPPGESMDIAEARALFASGAPDIGEPVAVLAFNGEGGLALDAGPVEEPAPPPSAERPVLPDPLDEPLSFWDGVKDLRRTGGFWAAIAIALATLMAAAHKRAVPRPGEEAPPPTSWRARSIALLAGLGAVLGAGADMLLGLGNWAAFFTVIVASASLIWRAINPPKSGVAK